MKDQLKFIPNSPGVYQMLDSQGNIIYIGKAKNLKNRISQYFHDHKDRDPKVAEMIQHINGFNYQITDTELDALIEECRLIKKIKPLFNRQMKNSQKYCYIKLSDELFPRLTVIHHKTDDGLCYYGPFTSLHRVERAVQFLNDYYSLRKCTSSHFIMREDSCLYGQLGACLGVCTGNVGKDEYRVCLERMAKLLNGRDKVPVRELSERLNDAVETLQFEKAAQYQEYYLGLQHVISKQSLAHTSGKRRNIVAIEKLDDERIKLFLIKGNRIMQRMVLDREFIGSLQIKNYLEHKIKENFLVPDEQFAGLSQEDIDEAQIISSYLKRHKKRIITYGIPFKYLKNSSCLDTIITKILSRLFAVFPNHTSCF